MRRASGSLLLACSLLVGCRGTPPVLDRPAILARQSWWDNRDWNWYLREIPFFESPDPEIDATYYYRWELLTKHLTYGSPETGYTFSEFIDRPFWSGAYGAISCPLGHQMAEARWLKDRRIVEDFARYWFETPGAEPRSYSNWFGDAVWGVYQVTGDSTFLRTMLPHMVTQYQGWVAERWDAGHRMFRWDGMHDGMETNINSRQTSDSFAGGEGYRPTLDSYLFADARAIAGAATLLGNATLAREYAARAADLKDRVQRELWDPKREFFFHQFARDEAGGIRAKSRTYQTGKYAGDPHGRELIGYVPWQFTLPDAGYESAWKFLMDSTFFLAPFGPTTVERHDPLFQVSKVCCVWSGNAWPYATSQTLVAMANLLNHYRQPFVTREDYARLLSLYSRDQRKDGRPYLGEAADPMTGSWEGHDTPYHSEHYFHSGYIDLVITGLAGLRPRADDTLEVNPLIPASWDWFALDGVAYRGRTVSIVWDRDGRHYRRGAGLSLYADGKRLARRQDVGRLTATPGPMPVLSPVDRPVNFAVNNDRGGYPLITASFSAPATPPRFLNDGQIWYHVTPPNRWTAAGSGNPADWIELDFGIRRPVESVKLYFLDDSTGIKPPARFTLERKEGDRWVEISSQQRTPERPEGRLATTVTFPAIATTGLRLTLTHQPGATSGLSEIEAWAHAERPFPEPAAAPRNLAVNPSARGFPRVTASFTSKSDRVEQATDGRIADTKYSRNRWSAWGTPSPSDWVEVALDSARTIARVELYFVADGSGLAAPKRFEVQAWNGRAWVPVGIRRRLPDQPQASAINTVWIDPVTTARIRVVFAHARPAATAVTELLLWGDER